MDQFHSLLSRQFNQHIGHDMSIPNSWQAFLDVVNQAYIENDTERCLLESALEISSAELFQANEELRGILHALPDRLFRIAVDSRIINLTREGSGLFHLPASIVNDRPPEGSPTSPVRQFWDALQGVRETKELVSFEYEDDPNSQEQFYEARLVSSASGDSIVIIRDITIRKQAEIALRVSEETARRAQADLLKTKHELEEEREKLRYLATRDSLTGIWNRRAIFDRFSSELARAGSDGHSVAVIMMDIDKFKSINDNYGHPVGDIVLQEATRRLTSCIRTSDEVGRYGGEEFLVVLPGCDAHAALARAEQLRSAIESEPISFVGGELYVTASFGVSWTKESTYDSSQLVLEADGALYRAKEGGRNRVEMANVQEPDGTVVSTQGTSDLSTLVTS